MTATLPLEALPEWLATEVRSTAGTVAVLAGHFAIFSAGGRAQELLDPSDAPPAGTTGMVEFTRHTWQVACDVAARHQDQQFHFVPLVDDIQFVRPMTSDRATSERLATALSADFLDRVPQLPAYHSRELDVRGLTTDRVLRNSDRQWLFSERRLRIAAVRRLRQLVTTAGAESLGLAAADDGSAMTVTVPEQGQHRLVQAGHTSCAGGYLELLLTLYERGVRKLVALVPMRCLGQVSLGATLAHHLFRVPHLSAVSVGIPEPGTTGRATLIRDP